MTAHSPAPPLRWWGWGERAVDPPVALLALLREECGVEAQLAVLPPPLSDVSVPPPSLPVTPRRLLVDAVGSFHVRDDLEERVRHAAGRSYIDLLRLRSGVLDAAPDAVVHPATADETLRVLRVCAEQDIAVVPFGGGTSVVGGVAPLRGKSHGVVSLDVDRLDALRDVDTESRLVTLEAGMRGPHVESELRARGLTLGHFPQSFEYATAGGFAATRSAGQASSGYGRFDEMVRGLRLQSPTGELVVETLPPDASGPSLLQMVVGSEGTLGVITDVTVRVRALPRLRHHAAWSLSDFAHGLQLLRDLVQAQALPDVARLSDALETRVSLAMARGQAAQIARRYLALRGHGDPCLLILGWEGDASSVGSRVRAASAPLRRAGAVTLGEAPAKAWLRDRFHGPYLRDALLDRGVLVETLETAALWSRLESVRAAVVAALHDALAGQGTPPLVASHVSHIYPEGASLYFTVLARQLEGSEVEQWTQAKRAATDAIIAAGGALTHHHGVGVDHARWLAAAHGERGVALLRAAKQELDPAGVMNPGKLLP